jgi:competence protein ComEC
VLAGAVVAQERLAALDRTTLRPHEGATVRGFVVEAPRSRAFGARVAPVRLHASGERVLVRTPSRVRFPDARVGDEVVARGTLRALEDREAFERRRNVHAVLEAERVAATGRRRDSPVDRVRRRAEDALGAGLRPEQAALARGMVLGQDHALPDDLRDAFRTSGLAHLVAASGTNVMLLAALVLALATAAGVLLRGRLALALLVIAVYVPVAGAGASIQRAGIMGAAGLVAALAGRPAARWYAVLLAAAGTLVLNPRAAEDPGWQLSFAAVLAILALHARLSAWLVARRVPRAGAEAAALTLAATLGTAPLLALHFEQVSLVSLPANLLAVPAVAPVMWLGTASGVLGGQPAELLNAVAAFPLAYLGWLARAAGALPHASVGLTLPGPLAAAALYAALTAPFAWRPVHDVLPPRARSNVDEALRRARSAWRRAGGGDGAGRSPLGRGLERAGLARGGRAHRPALAALAVTGAGAFALLAPGPPGPPPGFVLSVLDVGQGDAVLLQDRDHAILVDTGPPGAPLVKHLRAAGARRLDAVLVTHSSADHEGGLRALLDAMPVGMVLDGRGPGREHGGEGGGARFTDLPRPMPRGVPSAGQVLRAGRIAVEILWPPPGDERTGDPNLTATVALARMGRSTVLLTGDAESEVTLPLDLPPVDVLKVAHHGSEDPTLPDLLEETTPRTAVIPSGATPTATRRRARSPRCGPSRPSAAPTRRGPCASRCPDDGRAVAGRLRPPRGSLASRRCRPPGSPPTSSTATTTEGWPSAGRACGRWPRPSPGPTAPSCSRATSRRPRPRRQR